MFLRGEESFMHIRSLEQFEIGAGTSWALKTVQELSRLLYSHWDDNVSISCMLFSGTQNFYSHVIFGRWVQLPPFRENPSWSSTSKRLGNCLRFHSKSETPNSIFYQTFLPGPRFPWTKHHRWGNKDSLKSMWLIGDLLPLELHWTEVDKVLGSPQAQQLVNKGGSLRVYTIPDGLGRNVHLGRAFEVARKPEIETANYDKA